MNKTNINPSTSNLPLAYKFKEDYLYDFGELDDCFGNVSNLVNASFVSYIFQNSLSVKLVFVVEQDTLTI